MIIIRLVSYHQNILLFAEAKKQFAFKMMAHKPTFVMNKFLFCKNKTHSKLVYLAIEFCYVVFSYNKYFI